MRKLMKWLGLLDSKTKEEFEITVTYDPGGRLAGCYKYQITRAGVPWGSGYASNKRDAIERGRAEIKQGLKTEALLREGPTKVKVKL